MGIIKNKFVILILFLILLVIIVLKGFLINNQKTSEMVKPVKTMAVDLMDLKRTLNFTGDIKGQEEVQIFSNVSGRLLKNAVNEGETVKKGQTISFIDRDEAGFKFKDAPVDSPINGILGRLYLDKGAEVLPSTPIALVSDMKNVEVKIFIVDRDYPFVKEEMEADISVDAYPDQSFKGRITKLAPVIDSQSRSAPAEVTISNDDLRLRSGMFGRVKMIVDTYGNVIALPRDVILRDEMTGAAYVFIVEDSVVKKRPIELGVEEGNFVEVKSGVNVGEFVVTDGHLRITDGEKVSVK